MDDVREQAAAAAREWAETHGSTACKDYDGQIACAAGYELGHAAGFAAGARAFVEELERGGYRLVIHMTSTVPGSEVQETTTEISASEYLRLRGSESVARPELAGGTDRAVAPGVEDAATGTGAEDEKS